MPLETWWHLGSKESTRTVLLEYYPGVHCIVCLGMLFTLYYVFRRLSVIKRYLINRVWNYKANIFLTCITLRVISYIYESSLVLC